MLKNDPPEYLLIEKSKLNDSLPDCYLELPYAYIDTDR